ncbi:MAG TPA: glycosyltransferase [Mycobacteriales bacterium]|nr:glycosyltransferase [Mycobacteriales bacterium]
MQKVEVVPRSLEDLAGQLTPEQAERLRTAAARARQVLAGRVVWSVSSTATGGGVAEMLHAMLGYVAGAGVQTGWLVLAADQDFFRITKRLHNAIHGIPDGAWTAFQHEYYERVLRRNVPELLRHVGPDDIVLLHDPQPAGLVGPLRDAGVLVVWRSHIGRDVPNEASAAGWEFLRPYLEPADGFVFSRRQYAPPWVPADRLWVIPPSIDPLSAKNRPLSADERLSILLGAGLLAGGRPVGSARVQGAPPPPPDLPLVVQVSRWDRLKDMAGVMLGFAQLPASVRDAHLMLAGPAVEEVSDDPEGAAVLAECLHTWRGLPAGVRERVHLASLPMHDPQLNAIMVNALQRHAAVVVQKSLVEGFGLTVAEAMWKARPVVASAVGGIQDQIVDGRDGLLVPDPYDLPEFAAAVARELGDPVLARRLGHAAHVRVRDHFLGDRHLGQYAELFETLLNRRSSRPAG